MSDRSSLLDDLKTLKNTRNMTQEMRGVFDELHYLVLIDCLNEKGIYHARTLADKILALDLDRNFKMEA